VVEIIGGKRTILFTLQYHVQKVEFTRQNIRATTEMSALYTNENIRSDREKRLAATAETAPVPLWDGLFVQPVEGRISTQFGQMRYTNGNFTSRHAAIDIAAPEGTPIAAAAGGRVVLAEELYVSGKAVIIDHGLWLFTYYYHLSEIGVKAGDEVKAGDLIGKVGSTGYSTGPHLHYAAAVKGDFVNPDMLRERNPLE
jgi:murein DD-endopeptidase MepM/ murein hydrolase activator NlpD